MLGKINEKGNLSISRNGKLKQQYCPWSPDECTCGDHCPHFQEPIALRRDPKPELRRASQINPKPQAPAPEEILKWPIIGYGIELCYGRQWRFDQLEDLRPTE